MTADPRRPAVPPPDGGRSVVETLIAWVRRKNLQVPAAMLLEMHRPLVPLAWSAAVLAGPFLAPLFGADYYRRIEALRDPSLLDRVLERLKAPRDDDAGD